MTEPQQIPTPAKTPNSPWKQTPSRPIAPSRSQSNDSMASEDRGYESQSRSASRRRRRKNQRQRQNHASAKSQAQAGNDKALAKSMAQIPEEDDDGDDGEEEAEEEEKRPTEKQIRSTYAPRDQWLTNPATQDTTEQQPFEFIKPPSQSMDGPVTYARMMRGEIPWRGAPPRQPYKTTQRVDGKTDAPDPMDQDGLKLRLELNLDIEIELKAHIHGDLTLALL